MPSAPVPLLGRRGIVLGALLAPWAELSHAQSPPPRPAGGGPTPLPLPGRSLPLPVEVDLLNGTVLRPVHEPNKVLVLYWWASWCPFCAIQSPLIDKLWKAHRGAGLQVLGLSIDKQRNEATDHLRAKGYGFPSTWVTPAIETVLPKPKGLPVTVVLGRDGKVLMAEAGQLFPEDVEQIARFL